MMEQERAIFKSKDQFAILTEAMREAAEKGVTLDRVENDLWEGLLNLGRLLLQEYVDEQGDGDLGPRIEHQGEILNRLETRHEKRYVSVFGEIRIDRTVYGTRERSDARIVLRGSCRDITER